MFSQSDPIPASRAIIVAPRKLRPSFETLAALHMIGEQPRAAHHMKGEPGPSYERRYLYLHRISQFARLLQIPFRLEL